jgi:hypothetical protein
MPLAEEWVVAVTTDRQVVTGRVSEVPARAWLTICDDEREARRVAGAISHQLGLPQWGGPDEGRSYRDASEFVNVEADGPDPYTEFRNAAQGDRFAVVMFHDERYAHTDFPCFADLDDEEWEPDYIVSRHPTEDTAYTAAEVVAVRHHLNFPVEPGQFSVPVLAAQYRSADA